MISRFLFLCFSFLILKSSVFAQDTIRIIDDSKFLQFKGVMKVEDDDTIYHGLMIDNNSLECWYGKFDKNFKKLAAFTSNDNMLMWRELDAKEDCITWLKKDCYFKTNVNRNGACVYNPEKRKWWYGIKIADSDYGILIKKDCVSFVDGESDYGILFFCKYFFYLPLIVFCLIVLIEEIFEDFLKKEAPEKTIFWIVNALSIVLFILLPYDILYFQFLLPVMLFMIFHDYKEKIDKRFRKASLLLCYLVILSYIMYLNIFTDDVMEIQGQKIALSWKPGTGPLKRYIIRKELSSMNLLITANLKGKKGKILIGEKALKECTYEAVIGSPIWWFMALFNRTLNRHLTYREIIQFLAQLKSITGVKNIDIPSFEEISKAYLNKNVLVSDEQKEMTKTYLTGERALSSTKFYNIYEKNISISVKDEKMFYSVENVASPTFDATFRLVYRINNHGERYIQTIRGLKISETLVFNNPDTINVLSIDGETFKAMDWEVCREKLVESFYNDRNLIIEGAPWKISQKKYSTDYVFYPVFDYN